MKHAVIDENLWHQHSWRNRLQSLFLLAVMAAFLALLGWIIWGVSGIVMLLIAGAAIVLLNPSISPRLVMQLYGASEIDLRAAPALANLVTALSQRASLDNRPRLYYVPSQVMNAFAVGTRRNAAIALTDGILRQLDLRELGGVLAHEVSHVRNNDLWIMGLADTLSRATRILSLLGQMLLLISLPLILFTDMSINWLAILLLILAPNLSALAQLALSRTREYEADLNAVRLTGDPDGLARALDKIERYQGGWLERVFMPGRRIPDPSILRSHPHTRERIERLLSLKPEPQVIDLPLDIRLEQLLAQLGQRVTRSPRRHINGLWY